MQEPKRYLNQLKRPCDSNGTWYNPKWAEWAEKTIDDIRHLVTENQETKEEFINRVNSILKD